MKKIGSIVLALAFAMAVPATRQINVWVSCLVAGLLMAAMFMPSKSNGATIAGINREMWESHIEENLFPNNEFLMETMDLSEYVNVLTVHDPQAGAPPAFVKNRSKGGAATNTNLRTDTTNDWNIDEWTSDPFLITNAEEVQLSYDKMTSVLYETEMEARRIVAENMLIAIAPTGTATLPANLGGGTNNNILRSTGITNNDIADVRSSPAYTASATGNRLNFTLYDIIQAGKFFDKQNIPAEDRNMVMSPDAKTQIINDLIATKYRASVGDVFDIKTGKIENLLGFKCYIRSQVCQFNNAATPVVKAFGAAAAADDNDAILFWQKAFVGRAIGDIHVYETLNSAVHYGDAYSVLIRAGFNKRRTSEIGVGAIVQKASV